MSMANLRAELLRDVADHVTERARELGVQPEHAEMLGDSVADLLAEHWGGQVISVPMDHAYKLSQREREIVAAVRGGMPKQTAIARFRLTLSGLNKLLRRAERRAAVDAQLDMFGSDRAA